MSLSFELTTNLILRLKSIDNSFAKIYSELKKADQEELEYLHKYAKVSLIGASTRIENAILTDIEVNWIDTILTEEVKESAFEFHKEIIKDKLSPTRERSIEEVAGCRAMLMSIYSDTEEFYPLKQNDLRALHHELMSPHNKAVPYAGKYKSLPNPIVEVNKVNNQSRIVFETSPAGPITSSMMVELIDWYNKNIHLSPWPITVVVEFVYRFLAIHPFQDGNGRMGRGLFLLGLLSCQSEVIIFVAKYLPIDRFIEKHKDEYYFVLNKSSKGSFEQDPTKYKIEYFLKFMLKIIEESLGNIETCRNRYNAEKSLSKSAIQVLKCFQEYPEIRLSTGVIVEKTKLPRRTVEFSLKTLLDNSLLQRYGKGGGVRYQLTF
jgi:Fic family protein